MKRFGGKGSLGAKRFGLTKKERFVLLGFAGRSASVWTKTPLELNGRKRFLLQAPVGWKKGPLHVVGSRCRSASTGGDRVGA